MRASTWYGTIGFVFMFLGVIFLFIGGLTLYLPFIIAGPALAAFGALCVWIALVMQKREFKEYNKRKNSQNDRT